VAVAAWLASAAIAPQVQASVDLEVEWWVNGSLAHDAGIPGTPVGDGGVHYAGSLVYVNPGDPFEVVNLTYDITAKPDPYAGAPGRVLLTGNVALENLFSTGIDVHLLVELPIASPLGPGAPMSGSGAVGLTTDGGGGMVASVGVPVWQALTDGTPVGPQAALFFDPWFLENPDAGSSADSGSFGIPVPIDVGPINGSIGIDFSFSLTSLDQTSWTSVVTAGIPGPGTLIVLAAAGLLTRRRRR
jgi:hypothetical protein